MRLKDFIRRNRISVKISCVCLVSIVSVAVCLFASGATLAFDVSYGGSRIATVRSKSDFVTAQSLVAGSLNGSNTDKVIYTPKYTLTLALENRLAKAEALADAIIDSTDEIVKASALVINGEMEACVSGSELEAYVEQYRTRFDIEGMQNFSRYVDAVEIRTGYYIKKDTVSIDDALAVLEKLPVKTVTTLVTDVETAYATTTQKTSSQLLGYSEVATDGKPGLSRVTESVVSLNGEISERYRISNVVVSEPVDEVVMVGTARSIATAQQRMAAAREGFIMPLPKDVWRVSAYFGDGRNHKGVDLSAPLGTNIYAVLGGTVISSEYDANYGYCVVVDHGNGIKTRYAHASALKVRKGDTVEQGELLALVGSTGNSTGNHLHFEVILNGTTVDPSPYLGLA